MYTQYEVLDTHKPLLASFARSKEKREKIARLFLLKGQKLQLTQNRGPNPGGLSTVIVRGFKQLDLLKKLKFAQNSVIFGPIKFDVSKLKKASLSRVPELDHQA